jgi:hypothetical protein
MSQHGPCLQAIRKEMKFGPSDQKMHLLSTLQSTIRRQR